MAKYGINKVTLVGNLGQDPEVRHLDQGIAVCNFTLATSDRYKNKEGQVTDRTEWHNIVLWRGLAETAGKYLRKGSTVYIEGRIVTRSWDDQEGNKRYKTEIEAREMLMLDSRPQNGSDNQQSSYNQNPSPQTQKTPVTAAPVNNPEAKVANTDGPADDLPF